MCEGVAETVTCEVDHPLGLSVRVPHPYRVQDLDPGISAHADRRHARTSRRVGRPAYPAGEDPGSPSTGDRADPDVRSPGRGRRPTRRRCHRDVPGLARTSGDPATRQLGRGHAPPCRGGRRCVGRRCPGAGQALKELGAFGGGAVAIAPTIAALEGTATATPLSFSAIAKGGAIV